MTLDSPGAQPRQPMALRLAAGSTAKVAMVNKLTIKITVGGQAAPSTVVPGTRQVTGAPRPSTPTVRSGT